MLLDSEVKELLTRIEAETTLSGLKQLKDQYLGANGKLKQELSLLATANLDARRERGSKLQAIKQELDGAFKRAEARMADTQKTERLQKETGRLGVSQPKIGHIHPISATIQRLNAFFGRMGFSVYEGPEIETDEFNFQRLNVPKDHPAREMQDTIYIDAPNILLRTQTSSLEARALAELKPPFRIVCPGRVYRNEKPNPSNHFVFHHYQGVVVQERVSLAELFGTFTMMFQELYGKDAVIRFRNKYYPEVEPGVGPDMRCFNCEGKGCRICKGVGWIEMGGAGIIHEHILKAAGIDTTKWMGFAFALGLDRWVMAKYGITDIRTLLGGNLAYPYFEHESTL